jgi:hypothetical protein
VSFPDSFCTAENITFLLSSDTAFCESWSVREEHRLRHFSCAEEKFGFKRGEAAVVWKLYYEKLHDFYSSPRVIRIIKSRRMGWTKHVACL